MRALWLGAESGWVKYLDYTRLFVAGFFVETVITDPLAYQRAFDKDGLAIHAGDTAPLLIQRFYFGNSQA
jgi:hypothetical protein